MSFSRCARVAQAQRSHELAWDVLQLAPAEASVGILRRAADSFSFGQAVEGTGLYNVLIDSTAPPMAQSSALRRAGVFEPAFSLFKTLRRVWRPSPQAVVRSISNRTMRAHPLACVSLMRGLKSRVDLAAASEPGVQGLS